MGLWDNKNIVLQLYTRVDFSDPRVAAYTTTDENFSYKEYSDFLDSKTLYNEYADKIIRFFNDYKDSLLAPDRCSAYEPIKEIYDFGQINEYIRWLSQPRSAFVFKKLKGMKYIGDIENEQYGAAWSDDGHGPERIIPPVRNKIYFGRILLHFDKRSLVVRRQPLEFWIQLLTDIADVVKADKGYIKDEEQDLVLYRFGDLEPKDIWPSHTV